jgi:hypothetical protein
LDSFSGTTVDAGAGEKGRRCQRDPPNYLLDCDDGDQEGDDQHQEKCSLGGINPSISNCMLKRRI